MTEWTELALDKLDYNEETGILIWRKSGKPAGTITNKGYIQIGLGRKYYQAGKIVWFMKTGVIPTGVILYLDGNRRNTKFSNLSEVSIPGKTTNQRSSTTTPECDLIPHEKLLEILSYDKNTGEFKWKSKPNVKAVVGRLAGNVNNKGYLSIQIDGIKYLAHRLALTYVNGFHPPNNMFVDHINGNPKDNRVENLRLVSNMENLNNPNNKRRLNKHSFPGVRTVKYSSGKQRFVSQIRQNGKLRHLGTYDTPELASAAYELAKRSIVIGGVSHV